MKILLTAATVLIFSTPVMAGDLSEHFQGLDGNCWQYVLPDGAIDTRCFHVTAGNLLAINLHKLVSKDGNVDQEGISVIRLDPQKGTIEDTYYNSGGATHNGTEKRVGDEILFYETDSTEPAAKWIISTSSYQVVSPNGTQVYTKTAPSN